MSEGDLALRDLESGAERLVTFQVDRRRPTSCRIELRIREEGEAVSECQPLRRIRHSFRWLSGSPDY